MGAGVLLLILGLSTAQAGVSLDWPEAGCPGRAELLGFIAALTPAEGWPKTVHVVGVPDADGFQLQIESGGRRFERRVAADGACDERAAIVAAVIASYAGLDGVAPPPAAKPSPVDVPPPPAPPPPAPPPSPEQPSPPPSLAPVRTSTPAVAGAPPAAVWWVEIGALLAIGERAGLGAGVELSLSRARLPGFGLAAHLELRAPRSVDVAGGQADLDVIGLSAAGLWAPFEPLFFEAWAGLDLAYGRSNGLAAPGQALRVSPSLGLTARARPLASVPIELWLSPRILLNRQRFLVDTAVVLERPRFEVSAGLGVYLLL